MKKNTKLLFSLMAFIGMICTAACVCYLLRDRIKETSLFQKFFGKEEDYDTDFFEEDDADDQKTEEPATEETTPEEVHNVKEEVHNVEEEVVAPKARRGYIPLKFPSEQSA